MSQSLPPVERPRFQNRRTLCPVCLKSCDVAAEDIVTFFPAYLAPYDTLRAYDGFYHRACFYRTGDYGRIIEAWHRGEQTALEVRPSAPTTGADAPPITIPDNPAPPRSFPHVVAFERDLMAARRSVASALELSLFPRYATWHFRTARQLTDFTALLRAYVRARNRRTHNAQRGGYEIRAVANHDMLVLRWTIPLIGRLSFTPADAEKVQGGRPPLQRWLVPDAPSAEPDLAPLRQQWSGGDLEPEIAWELWPIGGEWRVLERGAEAVVLERRAARLRFVPVWDDEAEALVAFLTTHERALKFAVPD